jgi:hypothetical protein
MKHQSTIRDWQFCLSAFVVVIFYIDLTFFNTAPHRDWVKSIVLGSFVGIMSAFSGIMFWDFLKGDFELYLGEDRSMWLFLLIPTASIFIFGIIGDAVAKHLVGDPVFTTAAAIAGASVKQGLMPVIKYVEGVS